MKPAAALKRPPRGMKSFPFTKITTRHPGRRLAAPAEGEAMSRLLAEAGLAFPSSVMKTAALERWSGEATLRLRLVEQGILLRRLSRTRHLATALAAESESERTTPVIGSTTSTDPWH